MALFDTKEMKALMNKIRPYLNEHLQLPDNVPNEIRKASVEYKRLAKEQEEFALSL